jgi:hypothetical protein
MQLNCQMKEKRTKGQTMIYKSLHRKLKTWWLDMHFSVFITFYRQQGENVFLMLISLPWYSNKYNANL